MRECWCGSAALEAYGPDYRHCRVCGTLVAQHALAEEALKVRDDDTDFYGRNYWLAHQSQDLGQPDIVVRSRTDLTERDLHWLRALLKYRLPPAQLLEIGCAHGGFVALTALAGFRSTGTEMSPWVVDFARRTFGVEVTVDSVETVAAAPASRDVIVLMDVVEHLPDPVGAMRRCLELLRADGMLLIQMPRFDESKSFEQLVDSQDRFLDQLKSDEHLYLFSERAAAELFARLGAPHIAFEPAIFAHYDMFFAVGRGLLAAHDAQAIEAALLASAGGRMVLALLDLEARERQGIGAREHELGELRKLVRLTEENRDYWREACERVQSDRERIAAELRRHAEELERTNRRGWTRLGRLLRLV